MKNIFYILIAAFSLILHAKCVGQNNIVYGAGISYTNGVPTFVPPSKSARVAIDTVTSKWYEYATPGGWRWSGDRVQDISGCAAPAYTPGKAQSRLVLNACTEAQNGHGPELYKYTGSAWLCLNCSTGGGGVYTGGEGIVVDSPTIRIDTLDRLTFATSPTLPGGVGTVRWNDTDGTAEIGLKGGNVTLQLGQEQLSLVKHADNSGLTNGSVVYVVGSDGANKTVRYAKADAESTSANTFGVMTESATGGSKAFCTTFGLVRDLNTSALTEGATVWVSAATAGVMTTTRPTAPNHAVQVGFCIRSHATQGVIFVSVHNGYEIGELHDVTISSPTTGQALLYDTNKWVNSALPSPSLDALTDVTLTIPTNNQILQYNTATTQWVNATLAAITGSGTQYSIPYFNTIGTITGHSSLVTNAAGNRIGFGFAEDANAFTISANGATSATWALKVYDPSYGVIGGFRNDGSFQVGSNQVELYRNGDVRIRNSTTDNYLRFRADLTNPEINATAFLGASKALYIQTSTQGVAIGPTTPTDKLTVDGANGYSVFRLVDSYTPTGTADTNGNTGSFAWDANYLYIKTSAGWKRSALSTF